MLKGRNSIYDMEKIEGFIGKSIFLILPIVLPVAAFADAGPAVQPGGNTPPPSTGIMSVQGVLNYFCVFYDWAFYFLVALAVIFGVIAAFRYLTSAGNAEKVKSANSTLLYAAIAIAVALLARGIPLIVSTFLGSPATGSEIGNCG